MQNLFLADTCGKSMSHVWLHKTVGWRCSAVYELESSIEACNVHCQALHIKSTVDDGP